MIFYFAGPGRGEHGMIHFRGSGPEGARHDFYFAGPGRREHGMIIISREGHKSTRAGSDSHF